MSYTICLYRPAQGGGYIYNAAIQGGGYIISKETITKFVMTQILCGLLVVRQPSR